jgi:hypothetical protein
VGQSSAETVREIEDIRGRIDSNLRELEDRMPQPAIWAKRLVGIAVGGGIATLALRSVLKKGGGKVKDRLTRDEGSSSGPAAGGGGGGSKLWTAALTAAVVGIGIVQVRQLQRLNRSLATR